MRRGAGLCVLGLLCLLGCVLGQMEFCDDPLVQKAVSSALDSLNQKVQVGNKMALYQILSATKIQNISGSSYSIEFSSRTSDCPAGGDKSWSECGYLSDPLAPKEASPCNASVYMTDTETHTLEVYCLTDDLIVPQRASCLGCPQVMDEESEDLKVPLSVSIHQFNSISDSTHLFTLNSVGLATRQVVAGFRYALSFDMRKSVCSKLEHKTISDICVANPDDVELANCNATVDVAPWRHEPTEANVECGPGPLPPVLISRRRPPGWSPLRNFHNFEEELPSFPFPTPSATESSEEEASYVAKPTAAPEPQTFRCPSKPWKEFNPVQPSPTPALPEPQPFSDLDLLG